MEAKTERVVEPILRHLVEASEDMLQREAEEAVLEVEMLLAEEVLVGA